MQSRWRVQRAAGMMRLTVGTALYLGTFVPRRPEHVVATLHHQSTPSFLSFWLPRHRLEILSRYFFEFSVFSRRQRLNIFLHPGSCRSYLKMLIIVSCK
jgi:hypothetical protein